MQATRSQPFHFKMSAWLADDRRCHVASCVKLAELKVNVAYTETRFFLCVEHGVKTWKQTEACGRPFHLSDEALETVTRHPRRLRLVVINPHVHSPRGCRGNAGGARHPCMYAGPAL
ncbi:hypothetical protein GCM10022214_78390 [Actinomadura miaoliensis]|uniref:Uncharacterized protein n=1 Tax=Actinomadura miaoliensis TaxID=430685 RepID=A0ABP7WZV5_9ACTN